jgi:RNA polymerase sigma-70 factor (ECF subfamily)
MTATDLFERYHVVAFRYFLRLTGRRDAAEDLTQDLFVRLVRAIDRCPPEHEARWVFRIARNLVADYRRRFRRREAPLVSGVEVGAEAPQLVALGVAQALDLLNETEREAFLLREVVGLGYAELAEICDTKVETIRSRIYNARVRLKAALGGRSSVEDGRRDRGDKS